MSAVPEAARGRDGDPEAVAAVVSARNFAPELAMWRACGDLDSLKVARAVLRGLGVTKDDAKSLLRKSQWEAWVRAHGATKAVEKVPASVPALKTRNPREQFPLGFWADSRGLEPLTPGSVGRCSIQLSYESPGRAT